MSTNLQKLVEENRENPEFLRELIAAFASASNSASACNPAEHATAQDAPHADLLEMEPTATQEAAPACMAEELPKCKAPPAQFLSPGTPALPEDALQDDTPATHTHAQQDVEEVETDEARHASASEPPPLRAPWAELTEEEHNVHKSCS